MPGYAFSNRSPEADTQLRTLESFLDPISAARLRLAPGARCWEVGAGGGSVARLMADAVGPDGHVLATDIDPLHLVADGNLAVRRHDVRDPLPAGGPFDVIHARLVLLHVPERRRVLRDLAGALAPGGQLVVEEFDCTAAPRVLTAPNDEAAKLFRQVMEAIFGVLRDRGADPAWAQDVHTEMALLGLKNIDTVVHTESWTGGSPRMALYEVNSRQLEPRLQAAGVTTDQLKTFRTLTRDPSFTAMSYQFISTHAEAQ
ncbi:class I SAM-dependent methyltransferase [Actinomycetes bacterium KLBMP 9797]